MRKIIDRKIYDTETATEIACYDNYLGSNDVYWLNETLYQTKKGQYFIFGQSGAGGKYATTGHGYSSAGKDIILISKQKAADWLEKYDFTDELEKLFADEIEEG